MSAYEAVRIRLDPTPRQTRLLESHAGGARFAYNLMLAHVQRQISLGEKPDWTLYAMRRWWNEWKDEIAPWWRENSKEAYSSAFEWLSQALRNWSDSRKGRRAGRRVGWPKYKSKRSSVPRFRIHDRQLRPYRRRPEGVETATHRTRTLHGERHRTRPR